MPPSRRARIRPAIRPVKRPVKRRSRGVDWQRLLQSPKVQIGGLVVGLLILVVLFYPRGPKKPVAPKAGVGEPPVAEVAAPPPNPDAEAEQAAEAKRQQEAQAAAAAKAAKPEPPKPRTLPQDIAQWTDSDILAARSAGDPRWFAAVESRLKRGPHDEAESLLLTAILPLEAASEPKDPAAKQSPVARPRRTRAATTLPVCPR